MEDVVKKAQIIDQREATVVGLNTLIDQIKKGEMRGLLVVGSTQDGRDFVAIHVDENLSTSEVLGMGAMAQKVVTDAVNAQR